MAIVKVGLVQMSCEASKSANTLKAIEKVREAAKKGANIICLQEYNTKELKNDIANHATYFDQKYPYSFFSKDHQINEANYFAGNIIYSKYKILYAERVPFTNQESLIYVDLLKGDDTIRVFTTHLASFKFKQNDFEAIDDAVDANKAALFGLTPEPAII